MTIPELPSDVNTLQQMVIHLLSDVQGKDREILRLQAQLEALRHRLFGRRSEKIDPHQLALFEELSRQLEEARAAQTADQTPAEDPGPARRPSPRRRNGNGHGRRELPAHLRREPVEIALPEDRRVCGGCGQVMAAIGADVSNQLDYRPAEFVVLEVRRLKYACACGQGGVVSAPVPPQPIEKGLAAPGLLAQVVTSKFADHLPLHRQRAIYRRHGVDLADSTLVDWVRDTADLLSPIVVALQAEIRAAHHVRTDDTPVTLLNHLGKPSGRSPLWVYIGDERHVVFDFTPTHSRDGPTRMLGDYRGFVQADAYKGYDFLFRPGEDGTPSPRIEVGCWAHTRRKFYEARLDDRRRCVEMLALIGHLYGVEQQATQRIAETFSVRWPLPDSFWALARPEQVTRAAEIRYELRQKESVDVLAEIQQRLEAWSIEVLPRSGVGEAVTYARNQWAALNRYVGEGRLSIDNNLSERMLRMAAVGRKNWMFFGSEAGGHRAAVLYSLVASCRLCEVDPFAYLRDALATVCDPAFTDYAALLPRVWKARLSPALPN